MRAKDILAWSVLSGTALGLLLALATPTRMIVRPGGDWRGQIPRHPDPDAWLRRRMTSQATAFDYGNPKYDIVLPSLSDPSADYWANYYAAADRAQRKVEAANREARRPVAYPPLSERSARIAGLDREDRQEEPGWVVAPDPGPPDAPDAEEPGNMDGPEVEVQ